MHALDCSKFCLSHGRPVDFAVSQWSRDGHSNWYVTYRAGVVVYFCGFIVWDAIHTYCGPDGLGLLYFVFLTNWTFLCLTLTAILQLYASINANKILEKRPVVMSAWMKFQWFMMNLSLSSTIHVCIFYWLFVYPISSSGFSCFHLHVITGIYAAVDLLVHAAPRRMHHFYQPLLYGLTYLLFTWLHYECGGRGALPDTAAIYSSLDWARPADTLLMASLAVGVIIVIHALTCILVAVRTLMYRVCVSASLVRQTAFSTPSHSLIANKQSPSKNR